MEIDLVGDRVRIREPFKSVMTDEALEDELVDPVGDSGPPIVDAEGDIPPKDVSEARPEIPFPFVCEEAPAASIDGLLKGETARELKIIFYQRLKIA